TSVAVHQYTYQHVGPWTLHAGPSRGLIGTLALPVDCLGYFGPRALSVQYRQDVCGCPSAHIGRPLHTGTSLGVRQHTHDVRAAVRVCPSVSVAHTGRPWLSLSTHISTLVLGLSTLALPWTVWVILSQVGCLFSTHRTSMSVRQHTRDVRGCLWLSVEQTQGHPCVSSAHTGRSWVSVSTNRTFVCVRKHTQDIGACTCVSVGTHGTYVAVHQYTYQPVGRPWVSTITHRTSVAVRVCPSAHTGRPWLSISIHISTLVLGLSTLALPVDSLWPFPWTVWVILSHVGCMFSTHGTSVGVRQHTQDVRGCLW
ncbi:unnamed protein product, partial [Brassica rapa]